MAVVEPWAATSSSTACNAHARRYVRNAREQDGKLSSEILALYRMLYDIEERASRLDPVSRLFLRRRKSVPLMQRMEAVINSPSARQLLPKSKLGQALSYMRNNWEALKRFLSDARLPIAYARRSRLMSRPRRPAQAAARLAARSLLTRHVSTHRTAGRP